MSIESGSQFLKEKYPSLHTSPEVSSTVDKFEAVTDTKVSGDASVRINMYLARLEEVFNPPTLEGHEEFDRKERNISLLKHTLHTEFVITEENIPESVYVLEQRIARELGHGTIEINEEFKEKKNEEIIKSQEESLNRWIDYLVSSDAPYPTWAKYWAFRSVLSMGKLEKNEDQDKKETVRFSRREKDTVAAFPTLNPRALALTLEVVEKHRDQKGIPTKDKVLENKSVQLDDAAFQKLLTSENFSKIYTQFLLELPEYSREGLEETRGKWVLYPQDSDPTLLVDSLKGYPLEWCTASTDTAQGQLEGGDFYVYYSLNGSGEAVIPRVAIRMHGNALAEVRGIAAQQNLDPYIGKVVQEKMTVFPDGEAYQKKALDMRLLTRIERMSTLGQEFTKDDLIFLYEINEKIDGFGYEKDPRIEQIRSERDPIADAPIVFECEPNQIAHNTSEIREGTKAFIGPLFLNNSLNKLPTEKASDFDIKPDHENTFHNLENIEHIYTTFPEGRIEFSKLTVGDKGIEQLKTELFKKRFSISNGGEDMLRSPDFTTLPKPETLDLVRLKVSDLGLFGVPTTDEVYNRAFELGLGLCPAVVGPTMRLQDTDQSMDNSYYIAMKQFYSRGESEIFRLVHNYEGLMLDYARANPTAVWNLNSEIVFCIPKINQES